MKKSITTAVPPEELLEIIKKSKANIRIRIEHGEKFHGMPRWNVLIEGSEDEVEKFMDSLRKARAGG
ncbi:TIGR04140 family protein [Thermococci archaeon]|uniref:TIGR04140 family protein n=1 Tax=Palaeococcus sp. (in: euryarchaeotes) TaxID=2820298 RepID=UPI000F1079D5|nr:TIGR04140 family protein [Palaeococcus sp. (in: euryarchaeotes)]MCD6559855.1 TIGR04140 family protein [Palaeococcus sp. (in: euryarchaeotes)]RLF89319.1 MAG: TIGR04140 family protein [Thermococci archaeon]